MRKEDLVDNKGETMIRINETDLLTMLGENGERWVQGRWGNAERMCLHGAVRRCSPQPGDAFIIERVAESQGWGTDWNDATSTTWSMVRARLAHIEVTDADLANVFGPHWEHIVALVRRAAVLTADEARQLASPWDTAWHTAWHAARSAAWEATRGAAWGTARDTARDAAWDTAWEAAQRTAEDAAFATVGDVPWDAAWIAAVALVVRDLIGQYGFTQEHYDLLTGPWRSVIGPVHPDDAPMEARRG